MATRTAHRDPPGRRRRPETPRNLDTRRLLTLCVLVGLVVALGCAAGVPVRSAHGAQTTGDEPQYLLSAVSLAEDGNLDIADELAAERWRAFHEAQLPEQTALLPDGRRMSPHNPLLPVLLAPAVAVGGWVGGRLVLVALAGILAGLTLWVAVRRLGVRPAVAATVAAVAGLSPPLATYGSQVYPELPAALVVMTGVAALTGRPRTGGLLVTAAAVVMLPWLGVKYTPMAAVLVAGAAVRLMRAQRRGALTALVVGLTGSAVVYAAVHLSLYGGLTPYAAGDHFTGGELTVAGTNPDYAGRSLRLVGLLVDRDFGLAVWQPAWLLVVPATAALVRRRPPGWALLTAVIAAGWLTATFVALTMHGWWWPGRQVVVVLPVGALVVAWYVEWWLRGQHATTSTTKRTVGVTGLVTLGTAGVLAYGWAVVDGLRGRIAWAVDFFDTGNPLIRLGRVVLPDYRVLDTEAWVLHAAWIIVILALATAGWWTRDPDAAVSGPARA